MKAPTQEAIDDAMLQAGNDAQTCPAKSPATGGLRQAVAMYVKIQTREFEGEVCRYG